MLADISKGTILYFTPVLMLTALLLSLFSYLAPTVMLHGQVALLTVTPSSALTQPGSTKAVDGPSIFFGPLGSCSRPNNEAGLTCMPSSISPIYNTSVFTSNTPSSVISAPPEGAPAFIAISLVFSVIFFVMFTAISFRHLMGKAGAIWEKPMVQRVSAWIGIFASRIYSHHFMWFGKAADDFNQSIQGQGSNGPQLIATIGNAFTMIWVAYAFFAIPVVVSLAKFHVLATK
ncbi:hypothetical protein DFJ58DRAFT_772911 [Suillus subalutaceus]|uniref:uncharacterized protein n=1 Tax=Suillus subalutaceus TaxID=48586 RepID=UPI001B884C16|nr:uncharacterized protein DFJ58DRAFT_772911 [Suillus subalutaceus]KAG1864166.1 hypothetical protein DFJ58DRAFT_772911 [Suillus subalutaceus]